MKTNTVIVVLGIVAAVAIAGAVYVKTRPPAPTTLERDLGAVGGLAKNLTPLGALFL